MMHAHELDFLDKLNTVFIMNMLFSISRQCVLIKKNCINEFRHWTN